MLNFILELMKFWMTGYFIFKLRKQRRWLGGIAFIVYAFLCIISENRKDSFIVIVGLIIVKLCIWIDGRIKERLKSILMIYFCVTFFEIIIGIFLKLIMLDFDKKFKITLTNIITTLQVL